MKTKENRLKSHSITVAMLLFAGVVLAAEWCSPEQNLLPDPEMRDTASWKVIPEMSFEDDPARPGAHILKVVRNDPKQYHHTNRAVPLKPGSYHLKAEVRSSLTSNSFSNAMVYIEFEDAQHQFMDGGIYPTTKATEWTILESDFAVPPEAAFVKFGFCLSRGCTGEARLRYAEITPKVNYSAYLLEPMQPGAMRAGRHKLRFGVLDTNNPTANKATVVLKNSDGVLQGAFDAPVVRGRVEGEMDFPVLKDASLEITLVAPDGTPRNTTVIPVQTLPADAEAPGNAAVLDEIGRLHTADGKFFPVGLFTNNADGRLNANFPRKLAEDLDVIGASPFNTILPYDFLQQPRDREHPENDIAVVRGMLDMVASHGLRIIVSVKDIRQHKTWWTDFAGCTGEDEALTTIIGAFKDHPALLAWYTFDEDPASMRDIHRHRRALINSLDPWHPTLMVYFLPDPNSEMFGGTADIYGTDPYEIGEKSAPQTFNGFVSWTERTRKFMAESDGRGALWLCPQIFNFGHYRHPGPEFDGHDAYAYPSLEAMRTQTILAVILGAKGLVYYAFHDLFTGPEKDGEFHRRWPEVCQVASLAVELGTFALSDVPSKPVPSELLSGKTLVRHFQNDEGRETVLLAAYTAGKNAVRISLPPGEWRSRYGMTRPDADGTWIFSSENAASDILDKVK